MDNFQPADSCMSTSPEDVFSSSPLSTKSSENSAATKDEAELRSPVSVIEKFVEDITSPPSIISQTGRFSGQNSLISTFFIQIFS